MQAELDPTVRSWEGEIWRPEGLAMTSNPNFPNRTLCNRLVTKRQLDSIHWCVICPHLAAGTRATAALQCGCGPSLSLCFSPPAKLCCVWLHACLCFRLLLDSLSLSWATHRSRRGHSVCSRTWELPMGDQKPPWQSLGLLFVHVTAKVKTHNPVITWV